MNLEVVLKKYYGYDEFRKPQKEIIEQILKKRDTLTILPTGSGKSIIYQIPGLIMPGLVLVVSPLISLMKDQVLNLKKRKIKAAYISSDLTMNEINHIYRNKDKYKFLYVSAERLENLSFLKNIKEISLLVIDEAHTIKWGADFRKSLFNIGNFVNKLEKRPVIACFTATLNRRDIELIVNKTCLINPYLTNYLPLKNNLKYKVYFNKKELRLAKILEMKEKAIIYTLTRYKAEILYNKYNKIYEAYIYHGGMSSKDKNLNYQGFRSSKNGIIFCTNSFGMGIDITNIRTIILYDLPINLADLIQQAGRAGRDGIACCCYVLFSIDSIETSLKFIYSAGEQKEKIKDLNEVVKFCYSKNKSEYIREHFN